MKKIWIINHYATNMYKDIGGRHYWFAKNLIKNGYEPIIFCANTLHNRFEIIPITKNKYTRESVNGIQFVFVKTVSSVGNGVKRILNMLMFYINAISVSKKYSKKYGNPDLILASSVHPLTMLAGIKIAKRFKIPCICEVRDLWPEAIFSFGKLKEKSLVGKLLLKGEHYIYKKSDAIIFTKPGDLDYLKEHKWDTEQGGDIDLSKCYYINNGIDIETFKKHIEENIIYDEDLDSGKFNVIYTGAIRPINNVGYLLDAAAQIKDENIQIIIYGEGIQLESLRERVLNENLKNVKLKGFVNKRYIPNILSKSSLNILNYSNELYNWTRGNSSNKLFEYMASGKPILSTVKMNYCIIEKYSCGISIGDPTPQKIAEAILRIYVMSKEEYDKMGKNAKKGADDFDFKELTRKLIEIIESF